MDSGREVEFNVRQMPHLDYGYAVTSHSSQGQTADRVLVHVDSEQAHGELLNSRMAYVSVSRAEFDVQMYTNDAKTLGHVLSRDVSHPSAMQQWRSTTSLRGRRSGRSRWTWNRSSRTIGHGPRPLRWPYPPLRRP